MMKRSWSLTLVALSLGHASPALAKAPTDAEAIAEATTVLGTDPAKAIRLVEPIIASSAAMTPKPDTDYSCTADPVETLTALTGGASSGRNAVAYMPQVCDALFIKGFSLIDLNRSPEAEPYLRRVTELAPDNAHYLNEYAEWFKSARQWDRSYALFSKAADLAPLQPAAVRDTRHARSLRGMGYSLIELGRLDEAELLMNQSLKLEPDSAAAKNELQYIAEQRAKAGKH